MSESPLFSINSVVLAEQWITKTVVDQISATEGLRLYREAGGRIRDSYWYSAYREIRPFIEKAADINRLPDEYTVPSRLYTPTGADYDREYIYTAKIEVLDDNGIIMGEFGLTVKSSENLTIREWRAQASEIIRDYITQAGGGVYNLKGEKWMHKQAGA